MRHHAEPLQGARNGETAPTIQLRDVSVHADGRRLVGPVSFRVEAGEWTALLGRSGAGKSSLLRAVAGLENELSGTVEASDGAPLRNRLAWMAQDPLLAPWLSVAANVSFGARMRGETIDPSSVESALCAVGLESYAERSPATLSGGERQRVALARTLYEDRRVILLDEPFSALDALTRDEVSALAAERLQGCTVLHVTHDPLEAARLAHRVLILGPDGRRISVPEFAAPPPPRNASAADTYTLAANLRRALAKLESQQ